MDFVAFVSMTNGDLSENPTAGGMMVLLLLAFGAIVTGLQYWLNKKNRKK